MAITKIYKGTNDVTSSFLKAYKGSSEIYTSTPTITNYLTFQSTSSFTLRINDNTKHWDGTLYYSTDLETWNEWDGTTTLSSVGNKLYLAGSGNTIITGFLTYDYKWVLAGSNIECIGNIETLLDYETVASGNHPAMADYCYFAMFYGCTGLTNAPSLPATTLKNYCYAYMFNGCTNLTTAPSLPATTLADYCYFCMFTNCDGLTTAPSLPATTLKTGCYHSMFYGCSSLTALPILRATAMKEGCYRQMFQFCTKIKVSATQGGIYQHAWRIPTSGMGTTATNWNYYMIANTGGAFKSDPKIDTTYYVENPPV